MEIRLGLGDVIETYTLSELKEKYKVEFHNSEEKEATESDFDWVLISIKDKKHYPPMIEKQWIGKKMFVFSMDYRDYSEPCLCLLQDAQTAINNCLNMRMSGSVECDFKWYNEDGGNDLEKFFTKKVIGNIFDAGLNAILSEKN